MSTETYPMPVGLFGFDDERKDANERRARDAGLEPCTHCGRGVKPGKGFLVVVIGGGESVVHPDADVDKNDGGYMGGWVLGSTCAKQIPSVVRKTWEGWL